MATWCLREDSCSVERRLCVQGDCTLRGLSMRERSPASHHADYGVLSETGAISLHYRAANTT